MKRKRNQKISSPIKKSKESKDDIGKNDDSGKEEEKLEDALLDIVSKRGKEKTCWPSEVPRSVYDWKSLSAKRKKDLMVLTRRIAYRKAKGGFLHVLQRGSVIENPSEATVKGIIRLQLAPWRSKPKILYPPPLDEWRCTLYSLIVSKSYFWHLKGRY